MPTFGEAQILIGMPRRATRRRDCRSRARGGFKAHVSARDRPFVVGFGHYCAGTAADATFASGHYSVLSRKMLAVFFFALTGAVLGNSMARHGIPAAAGPGDVPHGSRATQNKEQTP